MTSTVDRHYQQLLAANYTWMLGGDIEQTARDQRVLLESLLDGPAHANGGSAVDLGCGSGGQTLALADMGYGPVFAVDTDESLLAELRTHTTERTTVETVHDDAVNALTTFAPRTLDLAVCMGDTLLHLPGRTAVTALFDHTARALRPGGRLVLTYRDLTRPLQGTDRVIPVRSTESKIMLCFLDFSAEDTVEVHDIIYTRGDNGWTITTSSYPKLRIAPQWVTDQLAAAGFIVDHHQQDDSGLWHTVAQRDT
ncbi:methyltransferase family protein [Murinocardiopsis flavida]|uniref:Methyltransferase family protein n=1 Tax=Murinocardiopsis flavida TaxID=645275 RepID=A0A2P8DDQ3_9ACTN|nr:class I SAM-dependent methyltransferase [Murinocardiopsis flavida]PSK95350.1 methyltransferase family protein [Murinocardiopsis flavida]